MRSIRYAVGGTILTAALQIVVGVLLWMHRAEFTMSQARLNPELSSDAIVGRAEGIVYGGLGTHLVLFVVYLLLARGVLRARRSARLRLSVLLLVSSVAGAVAVVTIGKMVPTIRDGMTAVQAFSTALRLGVLYLLWIPATSREFFATDAGRGGSA